MDVISVASLLLIAHLVGAVLQNDTYSSPLQGRAPSVEWTAWGDSYSTGVGAGNYINGRRCLRYDGAYPPLIQSDPTSLLRGAGGMFNNVACSGAKAEEVLAYQFYTEDHSNTFSQYYPRPSAGKPAMGTLTVGGDDIDFIGLVINCILETFPFPAGTTRPCEDQKRVSWDLISQDGNHDTPNSNLVDQIDAVIKRAIQYGQEARGNSFRLYVTGYGQFFNDQDPACDQVTFARNANPVNDGQEHQMVTRDLRSDLNHMSRTLNAAVVQAVNQNSGSHVTYIDIDKMLEGHRFCEPGITEPDQNNPKLWFFHYPYKQNDGAGEPAIDYLNKVAEANANSLTWDPQTTLYTDYLNDFWSKVDEGDLEQAASGSGGDVSTDAAYNVWPDTIGYRAKLFHPQPAYHEAIYSAIMSQYKNDAGELQCFSRSASSVPSRLDGATKLLSPDELLYTMRGVICNNQCERPAEVPSDIGFATGNKTETGDCEIAVSIQGGVEAYMYRGTPATGDQQQECWDETMNIIEECVKDGPNKGWVNGPSAYQFYEAGFRPLNADGIIHDTITTGEPLGAPSSFRPPFGSRPPGIFAANATLNGTSPAQAPTQLPTNSTAPIQGGADIPQNGTISQSSTLPAQNSSSTSPNSTPCTGNGTCWRGAKMLRSRSYW